MYNIHTHIYLEPSNVMSVYLSTRGFDVTDVNLVNIYVLSSMKAGAFELLLIAAQITNA